MGSACCSQLSGDRGACNACHFPLVEKAMKIVHFGLTEGGLTQFGAAATPGGCADGGGMPRYGCFKPLRDIVAPVSMGGTAAVHLLQPAAAA